VGVDALELRLEGRHGPGADELLHRGHAPVVAGGGLVPATATVAVPAAEDDDSARDQRDDRRDRPVAPQGPGPGRRPVTVAGGRAAGALLGGGHAGCPLPSLSSPPPPPKPTRAPALGATPAVIGP